MKRTESCRMSPLGAIIRGLVAGAVGTTLMDLLWYRRYRRQGGTVSFLDWEFAAGLDSWDRAPAPAQVGKRIFEGFTQTELPAKYAALTTNVAHWGYGLSWGAVYGIVAGSLGKPRSLLGLPFGGAVWSTDYIVLPLAKVYKPIWEYDPKTLWMDLSAHLTYGGSTGLVFRLLAGRRR